MPHTPAWQAMRRQGQSRQRVGLALSGMRRCEAGIVPTSAAAGWPPCWRGGRAGRPGPGAAYPFKIL
ncbi:protein of unknown function [Cupriavidus taiwanensis]|uniref:Uncharacterized protein n=1 Tax=Cupriavidus taiwanensis TaxID=164546 RepID=A0A7Z7NLP3_9BURK|nr:hypothetical protein CBM2595_A30465 [Cupriavidus taiwanensis]SOZ04656.1 hypothetical protein CBM2597_A50609 [Cupriavidus taiwanensis]SPC09137.1 hypothetical protein CBM2594_A40460 [Cupriavidus taiwanensis]SPD38931.1 protein of unknown function [Cupriavidus taiwanensis]